GIEVSEAAIAEGVQALKKDRFAYRPRAHGFARRLALLYVDRGRWARRLAVVAGLGVAGWLALAVPDWVESGQRASAVRTEVAHLRARLAQAQERLASAQRAQGVAGTPASATGRALLEQARAETDLAGQALAQAQAAAPRPGGAAAGRRRHAGRPGGGRTASGAGAQTAGGRRAGPAAGGGAAGRPVRPGRAGKGARRRRVHAVRRQPHPGAAGGCAGAARTGAA